MSVFLLNSEHEVVIDSPNSNRSADGQVSMVTDAQQSLIEFWPKALEEIKRIEHMDIRCQSLPLARIKKIMKLDEDVKMISAEAPFLFAKAAELFIQEITLRSWLHTEDNKRRTLQRNDIAMAITKYDQFDFLIDIVPREEATRPSGRSPREVSLDQVHCYLALNQQQGGGSAHQGSVEEEDEPEQRQLQIVQPQEVQAVIPPAAQAPGKPPVQSGNNIQVLQQVVGPNGEITHIPIQIPERQMELIRLQVESGGTPVVIPQVVQVRQQNPVFIQALNTQQN